MSDAGLLGDLDAEESNKTGSYVELIFPGNMGKLVLDEQHQQMQPGQEAALRIYASAQTKRAAVAKEDDLLTKQELLKHAGDAAKATATEISVWMLTCFVFCLLKNAQNIIDGEANLKSIRNLPP